MALFCFGVVNAGVPFSAPEAGVWSFPVAVLIGKPLGLLAGVALGSALGLRLPRGVHWRDVIPLGLISATGFTMALFFATATIGPGQMLSELKMGAVLSLGGCIVAVGPARLFAPAGSLADGEQMVPHRGSRKDHASVRSGSHWLDCRHGRCRRSSCLRSGFPACSLSLVLPSSVGAGSDGPQARRDRLRDRAIIVLFGLLLMPVSALAVRTLGWRTPRQELEVRIADVDWPLLRWVRGMVMAHIVRLVAGAVFRGSPVWTAYLRLGGARLGRRVYVNSLAVADYNLLEFGDDVVIGDGVHLSGHTVEHGVLKTGRYIWVAT